MEIKVEYLRDRIRGCLFGGAVGDALGYPVEFLQAEEIFREYGPGGIRNYEPGRDGKALISDDTQMTLFTANGLMVWLARRAEDAQSPPRRYVAAAYQDWLSTQMLTYETAELRRRAGEASVSWLSGVPELYSRRAPGNTCMSSLLAQRDGAPAGSVADPINHSKGCGGVMRVAPMGLLPPPPEGIGWLDREGAEIAAISHGHPLGYLPAAMLTHVVSRLVYPEGAMTLREIVREARDTVAALFADNYETQRFTALIDRACALAETEADDLENIRALGEGWVGDEALAIAVYCALRYPDDFSAGVAAAVNHSGDSDSTGAVTGNILGAKLGYEAIEDRWKDRLELSDVILAIADDLSLAAAQNGGAPTDPAWTHKYAAQ